MGAIEMEASEMVASGMEGLELEGSRNHAKSAACLGQDVDYCYWSSMDL